MVCTEHWLCERTRQAPCLLEIAGSQGKGTPTPTRIPRDSIRELRGEWLALDAPVPNAAAAKRLAERIKGLASESINLQPEDHAARLEQLRPLIDEPHVREIPELKAEAARATAALNDAWNRCDAASGAAKSDALRDVDDASHRLDLLRDEYAIRIGLST